MRTAQVNQRTYSVLPTVILTPSSFLGFFYPPPSTITMSHTPTPTTSSLRYQAIFDRALEAYKKKTKKDLRSHPLLAKLEACNSPDAVLVVLRKQIPGFDHSSGTDDRLTKWLNATVNVLYTLSAAIGSRVSQVSFKEFTLVNTYCFLRHIHLPG